MNQFTKEHKKKLRKYWKIVKQFRNEYFQVMDNLEKEIQDDLEIDDCEIFFCDGEPVGFGNYSRTIKLFQIGEDE